MAGPAGPFAREGQKGGGFQPDNVLNPKEKTAKCLFLHRKHYVSWHKIKILVLFQLVTVNQQNRIIDIFPDWSGYPVLSIEFDCHVPILPLPFLKQ